MVERVDLNALGSRKSQTSALGSMRSTFNCMSPIEGSLHALEGRDEVIVQLQQAIE